MQGQLCSHHSIRLSVLDLGIHPNELKSTLRADRLFFEFGIIKLDLIVHQKKVLVAEELSDLFLRLTIGPTCAPNKLEVHFLCLLRRRIAID